MTSANHSEVAESWVRGQAVETDFGRYVWLQSCRSCMLLLDLTSSSIITLFHCILLAWVDGWQIAHWEDGRKRSSHSQSCQGLVDNKLSVYCLQKITMACSLRQMVSRHWIILHTALPALRSHTHAALSPDVTLEAMAGYKASSQLGNIVCFSILARFRFMISLNQAP